MEYRFELTKSQHLKSLAWFFLNKSTCQKYNSTLRLELSEKHIRICLEDRNGNLIAHGDKLSLEDMENIRLPNVFYQHKVKLELEE